MNPAVEYLETDDYILERRAGRFAPVVHEGEFVDVLTCGGVTAIRPMFELIDDHENELSDGTCYVCRRDQEHRAVATVDGGILRGVRAT